MLKIVLLSIFVFVSNILAIENLTPSYSLKTTGTVQSMVIENEKLYAGTDNGTVEIFDLKTKEKIQAIKIPNIKDFMGDVISSKIYSIDVLDEKIVIVSQGIKGYRDIFIYENKKLDKVIDINKKMFIQQASFISSDLIIFGLLSNQIGLYDIKKKEQVYLVQVSASSFSHFMISEDKKQIVHTDESGRIRFIDVAHGKVIKEIKSLNLDKVYQLDYKNDVVITAGQDRKSVIYTKNNSYSLDFDFLLYACALSTEAKLGAIAYNEQNEVLIFDVKTKKYLYNLSAQKATLTQILFLSENEIFVSSDSQIINYYKLQ